MSGSVWVKVLPPGPSAPAYAEGTGGTLTIDGVDEVHTFTANGNLVVTKAGFAEIMVCGPGGNGTNGPGGTNAAAGGGGCTRFGWFPLAVGTYAIVVPASVTGFQAAQTPASIIGPGLSIVSPGGSKDGRAAGGGGSVGTSSGHAGGGADGVNNGTTPGPGVVWHGVEYGKGGVPGSAPTLPGQGGRSGETNAGFRGEVVVRFRTA